MLSFSFLFYSFNFLSHLFFLFIIHIFFIFLPFDRRFNSKHEGNKTIFSLWLNWKKLCDKVWCSLSRINGGTTIYLSVCLSYVSRSLSVCLSVRLSRVVYLSVCLCLSVCLLLLFILLFNFIFFSTSEGFFFCEVS